MKALSERQMRQGLERYEQLAVGEMLSPNALQFLKHAGRPRLKSTILDIS